MQSWNWLRNIKYFDSAITTPFFNIFDNLLNFFSFLQNPMLLSLLTNYLYYCFYIISIDLELF